MIKASDDDLDVNKVNSSYTLDVYGIIPNTIEIHPLSKGIYKVVNHQTNTLHILEGRNELISYLAFNIDIDIYINKQVKPS